MRLPAGRNSLTGEQGGGKNQGKLHEITSAHTKGAFLSTLGPVAGLGSGFWKRSRVRLLPIVKAMFHGVVSGPQAMLEAVTPSLACVGCPRGFPERAMAALV